MGLLAELKRIIDDESRVIAGKAELERHGRGFGYNVPSLPEVVVFSKSWEEIVRLLRFANVNGVPVVPFGQGSSLEGQVAPLRGGISLDTKLMNRVLEVRPDDFLARVEAGVTHGQLNARLQEHGLSLSRWTPAGTHPSAGWRRRTPAGRTRCATGRCATKS